MVPNYAPMQIVPAKGVGSRLWDVEGNEYIDFAAGIAVSVLGHAHPLLVETLTRQANCFWHVSNLLVNQPSIELAERLCHLTFAQKVFFANSGAEVNEAALKLARRHALDHFGPNKINIVAFDHSFHGRTFFTVSVGGQEKYRQGFGPNPDGIFHLPFNDSGAITDFFERRGDETCCVILEPIQGEGGVRPVTKEFAQTISRLCKQHEALMIMDEVQTGVGRSGQFYMYQKLDVIPDILTTAKGLGGGFPIGAMLTTDSIAQSLAVGTHGSTFGGNPMACAVANKIIQLLCESDLLSQVDAKSRMLITGLERIGQNYDLFSEIRGEGLLIGCELSEAWKDQARDILNSCMKEGLMVLVAGTNVLRLAPALNINDNDLQAGLERLEKAVRRLSRDRDTA